LNYQSETEPLTARPLLDTQLYLETPEGIHLPLHPAGLPVRALAFAIDLLLRGALLAFAGAAWLYLGKFGLGLASISAFILLWLYMVLFEVFNQGPLSGQTDIRATSYSQRWYAHQLGRLLNRNLLRIIDLLPFAYCIGILSLLSSSSFQRLGDLAPAHSWFISPSPQHARPYPMQTPARCPLS